MGIDYPMKENAMPKATPPKGLMPPSKRYPRWMEKSDGDLMYLGWGERRFELDPVPIHSNGGWVYWLVTEGQILIEFENTIKSFSTHTGMITGPDCAFGFPKNGQTPSKILAWIWKDAPPFFPKPKKDSYTSLNFSPPDIELLDHLHHQCRYEGLNVDELSTPSAQHLRALVDIVFTRASKQSTGADEQDAQVRIARQWMLDHLEVARPVEDLARYLNIAPVTLHRLFKEHLSESPGAHFRRLKMERAKELLSKRSFPVKFVAYELGYQHASDFSRAYTQFWGTPPSAE